MDGNRLFHEGKYADAAAWFSRAIESNPNDAKMLSNRSACLAKLGNFEDALLDAERAVAIDKYFVKGYGRLGAALYGLLRYEEACRAFEQGLAMDPSNEVYRSSLSDCQVKISNGEGLVGKKNMDQFYFDKSLRDAKTAMEAEKFLEAARHYTKAIELASEEDCCILLCNRSAAFFRANKLDLSENDARIVVEKKPCYGRGWFRLGMALQQKGDVSGAKAALSRAVELDPTHSQARLTLETLEGQGNISAMQNIDERPKLHATVEPAKQKKLNYFNNVQYCSFCNGYGHIRSHCPLVRKRPRE
jgi:tetratricopeptide (TPR) repeat protein